MKEQIKQVQEYFRSKILAQDYIIGKINEYTVELIVDNKCCFVIWTSNIHIPSTTKQYNSEYNFIDLDLNNEQAIELNALLAPVVMRYKKDTLIWAKKQELEKLEKEKIEAEAENKRKSEEAEKQRQALQKAAEERLNERKKALFALGFAESNGKMVFDTYILDLQVITSLDSNSWGKELDIATGHVSKRKIEIEAQRIANEKAEAEELEAAKGDKEKFQNLAFELESLKKKYSNFKSKKHQKLSTEVNGLIQKIQDYINLKN